MKRSKLFIVLLLSASILFIHCDTKDKQENDWTNLIDEDLSSWNIWMGVPHTSTEIEGFKKFEDVRIGTPIGLNKDPKKVFTVIKENNEIILKVSGEIFAGLVTKKDYKNYHFKWQFKWGEKKWEPRLNKKRNSGILYHSVGHYTDFWNVWMTSLECEVQETDCGDFITIGEGNTDVKAQCPSTKIGDKYVFDAAGELHDFSWNRPSFDTGRCFKPSNPEKPHGEWNTMELICLDNISIHVLNGHVVMIVTNGQANLNGTWQPMISGKIQIQSEAAEVFYKQIKLKHITEIPSEYKNQASAFFNKTSS